MEPVQVCAAVAGALCAVTKYPVKGRSCSPWLGCGGESVTRDGVHAPRDEGGTDTRERLITERRSARALSAPLTLSFHLSPGMAVFILASLSMCVELTFYSFSSSV